MENIRTINLPSKVKAILKKLIEAGFNAYVVGGAVRDSLLELPVSDYDITTSAFPYQVKDVFKEYEVIETGIQHGTVSIVFDDELFEITTFRIDGEYTDNRHPSSVKFTTSLEEDLSRRDFTVNALAADINGNIIDYFDGLFDLENKIIRCVGIAESRFEEDALRILRALRFSTKLNFCIHPSTSNAVHAKKDLLNNIAVERIQKEFNNLLTSNYTKKISDVIFEFIDVFKIFIPELCKFDMQQNNKYHKHNYLLDHTLAVVQDVERDLQLRLAAFFHDIGKADCYSEEVLADGSIQGHCYGHPAVSAEITETILKRMKYSNEVVDSVVWLVQNHDCIIADTRKSVRKFLMKCPSMELFDKLIKLKISDRDDHINLKLYWWENPYVIKRLKDTIIEDQDAFTLKDLNINGYDMINIGLTGKEIGQALNLALEAVVDDKITNTKEELIKFVTQTLK